MTTEAIVPRDQLPPGQWDLFVEGHQFGWWFHTSQWIDYALACTPGARDLSVAVCARDGRLVGVEPLVVTRDGSRAVNGGQPTAAPLSSDGCEEAVVRALSLYHFGAYPESVAIVARPGAHARQMRAAYERGVGAGDEALVDWPTYVVDLSQDEGTLWRNLRRSYHAIINKSTRERQTLVLGHERHRPEWSVEQARLVHLSAAGRETRPPETWQMMGRWKQEGHALLALSGQPVDAFAYALRWKDWAYYASAASLSRNVAHALIWELMRALKADGRTRYFEVGWGPREFDTDKERSIAYFKSGFGHQEWPVAMSLRGDP